MSHHIMRTYVNKDGERYGEYFPRGDITKTTKSYVDLEFHANRRHDAAYMRRHFAEERQLKKDARDEEADTRNRKTKIDVSKGDVRTLSLRRIFRDVNESRNAITKSIKKWVGEDVISVKKKYGTFHYNASLQHLLFVAINAEASKYLNTTIKGPVILEVVMDSSKKRKHESSDSENKRSKKGIVEEVQKFGYCVGTY